MSNVISKQDVTAYQRWEMASFGDNRRGSQNEQKLAAKISEQELNQLREAARTEGYAAGYKEAYALAFREGQEAGYTEGQQRAAEEAQGIAHLAQQFSEQLQHADSLIGADLVQLALDLSKAMVKTALEVKPELIIEIVKDAIEQLPILQQSSTLFLNAEDAEIIRAHLGDELEKSGWRIAVDHHLERGGCKLDTAQNLIDATLATRWERLSEALKSSS